MIFTKPSHRKIAAAPGGAQLSGCLSLVCPAEDETQGLMPGDSALTFNGASTVSDYFGKRALDIPSGSTDAVIYNVTTSGVSRFAFIFKINYVDSANQNNSYVFDTLIGADISHRVFVQNFTNGWNSFNYSRRNTANGNFQAYMRTAATWDFVSDNVWAAFMYVDNADGSVDIYYMDDGDGNTANAELYDLALDQPLTGTRRQIDNVTLANRNNFSRNFPCGISEFRIYDVDQIDSGYATPLDLFADVNANPIYP